MVELLYESSLQTFTIFAKNSLIDMRQAPKYAFDFEKEQLFVHALIYSGSEKLHKILRQTCDGVILSKVAACNFTTKGLCHG